MWFVGVDDVVVVWIDQWYVLVELDVCYVVFEQFCVCHVAIFVLVGDVEAAVFGD